MVNLSVFSIIHDVSKEILDYIIESKKDNIQLKTNVFEVDETINGVDANQLLSIIAGSKDTYEGVYFFVPKTFFDVDVCDFNANGKEEYLRSKFKKEYEGKKTFENKSDNYIFYLKLDLWSAVFLRR